MSSLGKFAKVYLALSLVILMQCQDSNAKSIPQLLAKILQTLGKIEKRLSSPLEVVSASPEIVSLFTEDIKRQGLMPQPMHVKGMNSIPMNAVPNSEVLSLRSKLAKIPKTASQENAVAMDEDEPITVLEERKSHQQQEVDQERNNNDSKEIQEDMMSIDKPVLKKAKKQVELENGDELEEEKPREQPTRRFLQKIRPIPRRVRTVPMYKGLS